MRILYAVQATGNGHISRACDLLPILKEYGEVDMLLSGRNFGLKNPFPTVYKYRGFSLEYNKNGGLNIPLMLARLRPLRMLKDAWHLPVENYDAVINDFEPITSLACKLRNKHSVHFGHQESFKSHDVPRTPVHNRLGAMILNNYVSSTNYIGLHFKSYDYNIFTPILNREIIQAPHSNQGHITVYLSQYPLEVQKAYFKKFKSIDFHIFSSACDKCTIEDNLKIFPVSKDTFSHSLISSHGVITGGGFETPAEAMYLQKKLLLIPIQGQYEQLCNAEAAKEWGATVLSSLKELNNETLRNWLDDYPPKKLELLHSKESIIEATLAAAFGGFFQGLPR
jgi:uncharacterized protein (TIGR00661 family)